MKIKKILLILVAIVVLVAVLGVAVVALSLDSIVKKGVETYGPQITKVDVKLDAVHIGILSGSCKIKGLLVGNPEGYQAPQSIKAGLIGLEVIPSSLFSDKVVVRSVRLEAPEITFEGGLTKNNLTALLANIKGTNAAPPAEPGQPSKGAAKKLQVDDFLITGAKVYAEGKTVTIPEIHLTALGTGPDGITAADLSKRALEALITATLQEVVASGLSKGVEKAASGALDKATKSLGDLLKK